MHYISTDIYTLINAVGSLFYSSQNQDNLNPPKTEEITYKKLKNIDSRQLSRDITETLPTLKTRSVSHLVDYYNTSMKSLLDKLAPEKMKVIKQSHNQPWFSNTIKSEIVLRRKKNTHSSLTQHTTTFKHSITKEDTSPI